MITITAGCLSKESVSGTPATDISPPIGDNSLPNQTLVGETPTPTSDTGTTNPSLNTGWQETGRIEVPADAWIMPLNSRTYDDPKKRAFPIGKTPATIWQKERHTFYRNVKITTRGISGVAVNEYTNKGTAGTNTQFTLRFFQRN